MNADKIIEVATNKKGQFASVVYSKQAKTLKGSPLITKTTTAHGVRVGAKYDALGAVKAKRESGELPTENQGLRGASWVHYGVVARADKTGELQLAISPTKNASFKTVWKMDGREVEKKEIECYLQASEKKSRDGNLPDVMRIGFGKIEDLK